MNFRDEEVICFCFGYTAGDIRQAIACGENTLDKLRESLEACDRCQGCRGEIQVLLSEQDSPTPQSLRASSPRRLSITQKGVEVLRGIDLGRRL